MFFYSEWSLLALPRLQACILWFILCLLCSVLSLALVLFGWRVTLDIFLLGKIVCPTKSLNASKLMVLTQGSHLGVSERSLDLETKGSSVTSGSCCL